MVHRIIKYMKEDQKETETEPSCTCVIHLLPTAATTSMWDCPAHGSPDDLTPLPGQGLRYAVMYSMNEGTGPYGLVGPLTTSDSIETAKFILSRLGYGMNGVYQMTAFADLLKLAETKAVLEPPETPPTTAQRLPTSAMPIQDHKPGCRYATQGHPGLCYVPETAEESPPWDPDTGRAAADDWLKD